MRDLTTRLSGDERPSENPNEISNDPLTDCFTLLAAADSWGKLALQRVRRDPGDLHAAAELRRSLEQSARLHPPLAAKLQFALLGHGAPGATLDVTDRLHHAH